MIHFVGAGPGAEDLITVRGQRYLEQADVVIYAGSLVNPGLLKSTKETCEIYNSAKMTLEEVLEVMEHLRLFRWSQPCPTYGMDLFARSVLQRPYSLKSEVMAGLSHSAFPFVSGCLFIQFSICMRLV